MIFRNHNNMLIWAQETFLIIINVEDSCADEYMYFFFFFFLWKPWYTTVQHNFIYLLFVCLYVKTVTYDNLRHPCWIQILLLFFKETQKNTILLLKSYFKVLNKYLSIMTWLAAASVRDLLQTVKGRYFLLTAEPVVCWNQGFMLFLTANSLVYVTTVPIIFYLWLLVTRRWEGHSHSREHLIGQKLVWHIQLFHCLGKCNYC